MNKLAKTFANLLKLLSNIRKKQLFSSVAKNDSVKRFLWRNGFSYPEEAKDVSSLWNGPIALKILVTSCEY